MVPENSNSSHTSLPHLALRRCYCGLVARCMTAGTMKNYGRRFYRCPRVGASDCGYWEWRDGEFSSQVKTVINDLKTSLDAACEERDNLKTMVDEFGGLSSMEVWKISQLEAKVQKLKTIILVSWAVFLGFLMSKML